MSADESLNELLFNDGSYFDCGDKHTGLSNDMSNAFIDDSLLDEGCKLNNINYNNDMSTIVIGNDIMINNDTADNMSEDTVTILGITNNNTVNDTVNNNVVKRKRLASKDNIIQKDYDGFISYLIENHIPSKKKSLCKEKYTLFKEKKG